MNTTNSKLNATVISNEQVADGLFFLRVLPDLGVPDFLPGQYVALGLPNEEKPEKIDKRACSTGSPPSTKEYLEFYIAAVPDGLLSRRLEKASPNQKLFCAKKVVGTFTLSSIPEGADVFFVSTGTGIAPFISMLRSGDIWKKVGKVTIVHGVRYESDLAYKEELESLESTYADRFSYRCTVSRPKDGWKGDSGYVQQFFINQSLESANSSEKSDSSEACKQITALNASNDHFFLCGNPAMVTELSEWLKEQGFKEHSRKSPGNLHLENYW